MPLRGHREVLVCGAILFILAGQLIGTLLALFLRPMASAISIATLLTAPAFGFMGIGFPRLGMNVFAHSWGALLPGTWYLMVRIDQTIRGTPIELSWQPILVLLAFVVGLGALTAWRLVSLRARAAPGLTATVQRATT
jgi:ABC-2 type transport system permease protein